MRANRQMLSAILALTMFFCMSCNSVTENSETQTAEITVESRQEITTDVPTTTTEPTTDAAEAVTEPPLTETVAPVITEAPEAETVPPVEEELRTTEPVLNLDGLPASVPAPQLFTGYIKYPMTVKAIGANTYFYCTGITGTPYSRNIAYQSEEYYGLVEGWYTFSPDTETPMQPLTTEEHTVTLTLGEEILTASYDTYRIGNQRYTVRPHRYTLGASSPEDLIRGSLLSNRDNGKLASALSVFLTDARYVYCTLVTNDVEDIVIYDTVTASWASLRERAVPTAERYEILRQSDIHYGMDTLAILLQAQFCAVSPNNDRFLYCVSDNNDVQGNGGTYFVYDLNTGRSTLVCNDSWEGSTISGDAEYFGWLDNDTIYIVPEMPSKQGQAYAPCYLIRNKNGTWNSEIITESVWMDRAMNIGSDVYLADSVNGEIQYYHAETGATASDALNTLLTDYDSFYLALSHSMHQQMWVHDGIVYQNNHGGTFTIYDTQNDQLYRITDTALTYEGNIFITNMFLAPDGILLNLETQPDRYGYIYYLPYEYLENLRT